MKKAVLLVLCFLLLIFASACGIGSKEIVLTKENFDEYFFVDISGDMKTWTSGFGAKQFTTTGTVDISSAKTAKYDSIVIQGKLHINVDKDHLLYVEGKFPIDVTIQIDSTGRGSQTISYTHGTGSYGGYGFTQDAYFVVESISGKIILE